MKCKNCNYALWNLTEPRCPECGTAFDVQRYWFAPDSVIFKCPFCNHPHYGRDARGLPFDAGRCDGCGQMLVVEQMPVEPVNPGAAVDMDHDDDFSPFNRSKHKDFRKAMLAVIIAIAAFLLFFFVVYFIAQSR